MKRLPIYSLLATNLISSLGNTMTSLAVPWFVLESTGSASKTGLTAAVALIPTVFASFFGGALADRTNRKGLSVFADVMSALTLAAIPLFYLADTLSFPLLLILMFLGAIFDAPGSTARQAMIPELAERGEMPLERINSAFGVNQAIASLVGAPIAGVMIAVLGPVNVLWFAASAFVVSIIGMLACVPALPRSTPIGESYLDAVKQGFSFVAGDSLLRTLIFASIVINFIFSPIFGVAIPLLAKQEYGSAQDLGFLMSAMGLGMLLGALGYGVIGRRVTNRVVTLASLVLMGSTVAAYATMPPIWIACGISLLTGFAVGLINPLLQTIVQKRTPSELLGRVVGVLMAGSMVASPLGLLIGGAVISWLGLPTTMVASGCIVLVVFAFCVVNPDLRGLDDTSVETAPPTTTIHPIESLAID